MPVLLCSNEHHSHWEVSIPIVFNIENEGKIPMYPDLYRDNMMINLLVKGLSIWKEDVNSLDLCTGS